MSRKFHWVKLVIAIAVAQSAGVIGAFFTTQNISSWYTTLQKPELTPPNWLFGPVWTLLYAMMGIALFLAWTRHAGGKKRILWIRLFLLHLILNTAWSILFFGQKMLFVALLCIGALWVMIAGLIALGAKFDTRIAYLLVPYLLWVSYASYLNYSIWQLNK
jgi:tryptophan-rich sensory protein